MTSQMLEIPTRDGKADAYVSCPASGRQLPGILLYMDAIGLRPAIKRLVDDIASKGFIVVAPNLFYREDCSMLCDLPEPLNLQARPELLARVRSLMASLSPDKLLRDASAYLDFVVSQTKNADRKVGVVGYCFSGNLAIRTAAAYPERIGAVAVFHGGNLAAESHGSSHLFIKDAAAEFYFGHAEVDASMPPEQIDRLNSALKAANLDYRSEIYPGTKHGFAMPDLANYDEDAATRHRDELVALMQRAL